jgi:hypothetical protein
MLSHLHRRPAATEPAVSTDPATKPQATADAATPAAADSVTSDGDPPRNDKGQFIPKKRFDEVNQRRKAAEDKLAQFERENKAMQQAQDATYDFDAKEKEYLDLVLDGKTEEAIATPWARLKHRTPPSTNGFRVVRLT